MISHRPKRTRERGNATEVRAETGVAVVGSAANETNVELVAAWRARGIPAQLVSAADALTFMLPGELALARLDVLPTLDGIEDGLLTLLRLERQGVRVLNTAFALLGVHDKLLTARRLTAAGIRHPHTIHVPPNHTSLRMEPPLVLKPRFGSWGRDVVRCRNKRELTHAFQSIRDRPWFRRHGVLAQQLVPTHGRDLRLLVAGREVVGAAERTAAEGEWRTNVSLGGSVRHVEPDDEACAVGIAAARAVGADAVGIDLIPGSSGYVVLELNGAADFDSVYSREGGDVYADLARAIGLSVDGGVPRGRRLLAMNACRTR